MSSRLSTKSPILIEDLIAGKQGLGAEISFEPNTFEVKANNHGINGVFTRHSIPEGYDVLSVPKKNGGLTKYRAYEEAQDLLQKLGPDRFNLNSEFILACALYLRHTNAETKDSDLLVIQPDIEINYSESPSTCHGSKDLIALTHYYDSKELNEAAKQDQMINKMGVDPGLFRSLLAYVTSKYFKDDATFVPVFDWINSSHSHRANCMLLVDGDQLCYRSTRDIQAGEELVRDNKNSALLTWLIYGFRDYELQTLAFMEVNLNEEKKAALEKFISEKLTWLNKHEIFHPSLVNKHKMSFSLKAPGKLPTPELAHDSIMECLQIFNRCRIYFRAIVLSEEQINLETLTEAQMKSDVPPFGLKIERKVISAILKALNDGLMEAKERVKRFEVSEVGRSIDMTPYIDMMNEAHTEWTEALKIIEAFCSTENIEECITIINTKLELDIKSKDQITPTLVKMTFEQPTLALSLITLHLLERL